MKKTDYKKEFCNTMSQFNYKYSKWQIWNDFLCMAAISIANTFPSEGKEEREQQYLSIVNKYTKEEQERFPKMLAIVAVALSENPKQDFFGELYHKLNLQQEQKEQFFTPYHVCEAMSELNFSEGTHRLKDKPYITVSDPTCGSGAMLIAFANTAREHGLNYQKDVLFVAQDIDQTAVLMSYVQLSLLGCPAIVIRGDSLVHPGIHPDNDVWLTPLFHMQKWKFINFSFENDLQEEQELE